MAAKKKISNRQWKCRDRAIEEIPIESESERINEQNLW